MPQIETYKIGQSFIACATDCVYGFIPRAFGTSKEAAERALMGDLEYLASVNREPRD